MRAWIACVMCVWDGSTAFERKWTGKRAIDSHNNCNKLETEEKDLRIFRLEHFCSGRTISLILSLDVNHVHYNTYWIQQRLIIHVHWVFENAHYSHYLYHSQKTPNVGKPPPRPFINEERVDREAYVWLNGTQNRLRVDLTSNPICDTFRRSKYTISTSRSVGERDGHRRRSTHHLRFVDLYFSGVDETQTVMAVVRIYIISNIHQLRFISLTNVVHAGCVRRP